MFSLDALLENTTYTPKSQRGPVIVSENHDASSINWVRGMSDPGEMIACGAYQELRRQDGEADDVYAARINVLLLNLPAEHREKIVAAGKRAAIARAGLDVGNGKVNLMVAGECAWHGLGVNIQEATTSDHAMRLIGLEGDFLRKVPGGYMGENGFVPSKEDFFLVRCATGKIVSQAGTGYKVVQPAEVFRLMDKVAAEFGAKYHVAGVLNTGVFMGMHLPAQSFRLAGADQNDMFAMAFLPDRCGESMKFFTTANRVVCQNTLNTAMGGATLLKVRHTGDVALKQDEVRAAYGIAIHDASDYKAGAEELARKELLDVVGYFADVLDQSSPVSARDMAKGAEAVAVDRCSQQKEWESLIAEQKREAINAEFKAVVKQFERREAMAEILMETYESTADQFAGTQGTAWKAMNAVTDAADHHFPKLGRQRGTEAERTERRFLSSLGGEQNEMKQVAYKLALAY